MMTQKDRLVRRGFVAPIFVKEALECASAGGVCVDKMLVTAGVARDQLEHLDTQEFGRIWLQMSFEMQDEFFGLGARAMRPGSTTLLGHAIRGAKTLDVALARSLRFLKVVLAPSGDAFKYRAFFLILHGINCWAARERIPIKAVEFPCAEPATLNDYGDFFGVSVTFEAPKARLVFDRKYLTRKTDRSEEELKVFLRSLPEAFLRGYRETEGVKHEVISKCLSGPAEDWPNANQIAAMLGMSRSSLHRLLKDSGHSLTQLKDEQRRNRAMALLSRTEMSVSQISAAVGYAEEAAFYRAFHRWYGVTPNSMRVAGARRLAEVAVATTNVRSHTKSLEWCAPECST